MIYVMCVHALSLPGQYCKFLDWNVLASSVQKKQSYVKGNRPTKKTNLFAHSSRPNYELRTQVPWKQFTSSAVSMRKSLEPLQLR
jgi:hypothetical protein